MIAYIAALIALAGLLVYLLSANPKAQELGRIMFFCGLLVTTFALGGHAVKVF